MVTVWIREEGVGRTAARAPARGRRWEGLWELSGCFGEMGGGS